MRSIRAFALCIPVLSILLAVCGLPPALHAQSPQLTARITGAIDESSRVTLKGSVHPLVRRAVDQGAAPGDLQLGRMQLLLKPTDAQQAALRELLQAQQNKRSEQYHKWLTPAQFGEQFGVAQQDIDTITGWLQSHGFSIESVSQGRNLITFSGTNAQLQNAFRTTIHSYKVNGEQHHANASDPSIPAALAPAITGITALNDFTSKPSYKEAGLFTRDMGAGKWIKATQTQTGTITEATATGNQTLPATGPHDFAVAPQVNTSNPTYYAVGPYDFATIYNVLPLWKAGYDGTGQTIAIVGRSDIHPADVDSFRSAFGLPAKNLNIILDGPDPGFTTDEPESDLDVEWSGAVARGATIDYVEAGTTFTTDGAALAAQYIVDNNIAPILSISYGECEAAMGPANQFYNSLWQQAAAQGITVFAAAGDAGSAVCDNPDEVIDSVYGLAVSGIASTPYDVAAGGTDFSGNYNATSTYWSATNNPTTLQSALSYIPETPWNDSCGNPLILPILGPQIGVTTAEELCNSTPAYADDLIDIVGGGGGQSGYAGTDGLADYGWEDLPAYQGYAKPAWQAGVPGIPSDGVRDLPDVSLFAGNGFWGSFYVVCDSDDTSTGSCDFTDGGQVLGAGGTSFVAPSFSGILAIVNQYQAKQGQSAQQGNANYILYKLAANEYNNATTLAACGSSSATANNACVFYDINQGANVVPCGFPSPLSPGCTIENPNDGLGLLTGWTAGAGYDLASGLGSVNAYNLVTNWGSASSTFAGSQTALTPTTSSGVYGTPFSISIAVAAASGETGTPSGSASIILGNSSAPFSGFSGGPFTLNGSAQATGQITGLPAGTDTIEASYSGDATFAGSTSTGTHITIAQAATATALIASRSTLASGDSVTFNLTINTQSTANSPTGSVVFTDSTNGTTLGTVAVQPAAGASGNSIATATFNVPASVLAAGINNVTATYSGDANYTGSTTSAVQLTNTGGFALSINPSSVALSTDGSGTATVTITPASGSLSAAVTLACAPALLPAGMSCAFSPAVIPAGSAAATSILTLQTAAPLAVKSQSAQLTPARRLPWPGVGFAGLAGGAVSLAGVVLIFLPGFLSSRKRYLSRVLGVVLAVAAAQLLGCGGSKAPTNTGTAGGSTSGNGAQVVATTTALASSGPSALLGTTVTFATDVAAASSIGTPTGTVTFLDSGATIGTASLANGTASFSSNTLSLGTHAITAQYSGDSNFSASTSPAVTVNILYTATLSVTGTDGAGDTGSATLAVTVQ
jgi:hypothetical protein